MSGFFFTLAPINPPKWVKLLLSHTTKPVDMRRLLLAFAVLCCFNALQAQTPMSLKIKDPVICYAQAQDNLHYIAPPEEFLNRKNNAARTNAATIEVTYVGFESVPQAQQAFQRAIDIWAALLDSSVPIRIEARWTPLAQGVLGSANYTIAYANFKGAQKLNVFYPVAIAERITGEDMNGEGEADIFANFSSVFDWHFDPDTQPPSGKYDLTTVVLHEIGHGLGFSGTFRVSRTGTTDTGSLGLGSSGAPIIYDIPIETSAGANLIETIAAPSTAFAAPLKSNNLFFDAPSGRSRLYAPATYDPGSSISHLNESTYNNTPDALMTPFVAAREQHNDPGLAFEILKDIGWETIRINHERLSGTENITGPYTITANIDADNGYKPSSVTLHYSTGAAFTTVQMMPSGPTNTFSADIPFSGVGAYEYFISVENEDEIPVEYVNPGKRVRPLDTQLQLVYTFEVGPDTRGPIISHAQQPFILETETELEIEAVISDNTGGVTALVEYFVNNVQKADIPLTLISPEEDSVYTATINIASLVDGDQIKYRIKATDQSSNQNVSFLPAEDYFILNVVGYGPTQDSYENDFETAGRDTDFFGTGYTITQPSGFTDRAIHSEHPYISGDNFPGNERNLIYQLKVPIRVKAQDATIKFDEIALIEINAAGAVFGGANFFDYVIVEGSKDGGETWEFLLPGYNARDQSVWLTRYNSAVDDDGNSTATGDPTLYRPRTIDLLQTFEEGDEVILRFRTYIDQLANAWGWTIDNLKIQIDETPPLILHDHVDFVTADVTELLLPSKVSDAEGIEEYAFEVFVNDGEVQVILLDIDPLPSVINFKLTELDPLSAGDVLHYRFVAKDVNGNESYFPPSGVPIDVAVLEFGTPITEYSNNFDATTDFVGNFFNIATPSGFTNKAVHSDHFYATGRGLDLTSNFSFMLKKPVTISESNSIIQFDEIVLVEGQANNIEFGSEAFNDYVIVEGSKDDGENWIPFTDGYDVVGTSAWVTAFNNKSNGTPSLFRTKTIDMKSTGDFETGDDVLIRFRLFSNETIDGWGWAIDNLYIQDPITITGVEDQLESAVRIHPNPARTDIFVEAEAQASPEFSIEVLTMQGQNVYSAHQLAVNGKMVHTIAAANLTNGMYLVKISNGSKSTVRKVIKAN